MEKYIVKIKIKNDLKGKYSDSNYIQPEKNYFLILPIKYTNESNKQILIDFVEEQRVALEMLFYEVDYSKYTTINYRNVLYSDFEVVDRGSLPNWLNHEEEIKYFDIFPE